jgi:c-di-GMP-binding flagellar brake protein YcgR
LLDWTEGRLRITMSELPSKPTAAAPIRTAPPSHAGPGGDFAVLREAIARNGAAVLSLPSAGMLRHHKSRLLAEAPDGFWIEGVPAERALVDGLIAAGSLVGISFKSGTKKAAFTVPMLKHDPHFAINPTTTVDAILVKYPSQVRAIQRRNSYRVRVPRDSDLRVRVWRIPEHHYLRERPLAALELAVEVRDISTGGLGVLVLPKDSKPPKVLANERLRVEMTFREDREPLILEGRMCYSAGKHPPGPTDQIRAGVQFKKLQNNMDGRQTLASLTRIVGELQREEVRRRKLGIKDVA